MLNLFGEEVFPTLGIAPEFRLQICRGCSANCLPLDRSSMRTARRPSRSAAKSLGVKLELGDGAAESIAVHTQLAGSLALVAVAVLQNRQDEFLLELANGFRIRNTASVHLHHQGFQLIFHDASLSAMSFVMALRYVGYSHPGALSPECAQARSVTASTHPRSAAGNRLVLPKPGCVRQRARRARS